MVAVVAILVWRLPAYVVLPIWLVFAALDGAFLSSVLEKVPDGAWFTLLLAVILSSVFTLWRFGKEVQWKAEGLDQVPPQALFEATSVASSSQSPPSGTLSPVFGGLPLSTVHGLGIFFDKIGDPHYLPECFSQFVVKFAARPAVVIFFHMRPLSKPTVPLEERYVVTRMARLPACYNVTLRHGYADDVLHQGLALDLVTQIELAIEKRRPTETTQAELRALREALNSQMVYVLGKEVMKIRRPGKGFKVWPVLRSGLLWIFLWIRENSRTKLADLDIDADKLVEVGFVKEI